MRTRVTRNTIRIRTRHTVRWYDVRTKKRISKKEAIRRKRISEKSGRLWRLTIALNYVIHRTYYSVTLQIWSKSQKKLRDEDLISDFKAMVYDKVTETVGRSDWIDWNPSDPSVEVEQVDYDEDLFEREPELEVEEIGAANKRLRKLLRGSAKLK